MTNRYRRIVSPFLVLLCIGVLCGVSVSEGATMTSPNFSVLNPIFSNGLGSALSSGFGLGQSFGQQVVGRSTSSNFQVWSGYQYFTRPTQFTLVASSVSTTTGTISVGWTTPVIRNGEPIIGYEVGIGTTPYSFTFQSVGLVSSYTKTGLTNGVTYYVVVKAVTNQAAPIAFSNTARVVPSGTTPSSGGGGGGGGSSGSSSGGAVSVSGMAYPNTKVTLIKDGKIVGTTIADPGATFRINANDLSRGSYVFGVYAQDSRGIKSTTYSFPVSITESITVAIDNVFLAPTIGVDSSVVKQGDPIGIFGSTAPNAEVTVHVHSLNEIVDKVAASSAGLWFKQFDTSLLEIGNHITFSRSALRDQITDQSETVGFVVGTQTIKQDQLTNRSDLNNDGAVNITDFSMLLFYWYKVPPASSKADINKSGVVDITDLSIMLYDWTG